MVYKCKICGGQTTLDVQNGISICEYCGTKQALPLFTEDSERLLYERGNNYLSHSEYDKAENVFNQLLTIKPGAAELYWDLVLCKYGVTYVKDPKTGKYIPTCNRTHYTPIFSDENYKKAIELSSGEKKALFENDAKIIDEIQKGIIAVSKKEKPFDIFISYKETDANGNRTKDSVEAQKLYEKLTEAGYKVFFSRITLEDKVGTEYEPYIYAALYSSKVMITVCSSKENIEAVWVKNEWGRFLSLQQNDADKTLIPIYFDMEKSDLPDEFALIPSFDIKDAGFEAELIRGIKKQIPLPIMIAKKRKARRKTITISLLSFLSVAIICGAIFLPTVIKNYIQGNKYDEAMQLFKNQNYAEAKIIFETITDYENSKYMVERCNRQPEYDAAMQLYYDGEYAQASWAFKAMGDYEDAADMQKKSEDSWRKSLANVYAEGGEGDSGQYYITENGTINIIKGTNGNAHSKVDIAENGKVISIISNSYYSSYNNYLTVLHENGQVSNSEFDNKLADNPEWHDIIKVSEAFRNEIIGLRSDGKIVVISDNQELAELSTWNNIIDFKENYSAGNGLNCGIIVGLKADGTLCVTQYSDALEYASYDMNVITKIIQKFKNVECFSICDQLYDSSAITITARTKDGKLLIYDDNKFVELDGKGICDIISTNIVLKSNGDLVELSSGKVLIRDIVYSEKGVAITRNGNIFRIDQDFESGLLKCIQTGNKTTVCEEWVSRLD